MLDLSMGLGFLLRCGAVKYLLLGFVLSVAFRIVVFEGEGYYLCAT
jgi:hypothetical protein